MFLDFKKVFMLAFMKLLNIVEQNLSCDSMDNRGIYVIYMPTTTKTIVMMANPFNNHEIIVTRLECQFQNVVCNQDQPNIDIMKFFAK
jgi:hypothetical protein